MQMAMGATRKDRDHGEYDRDVRTSVGDAKDAAIANAIAARLSAVGIVPANRLRIGYTDGTVTVSGLLDWQFQRQAVIDHLRRHTATQHIIDEIEVRPLLDPALLMQRIDSVTLRG